MTARRWAVVTIPCRGCVARESANGHPWFSFFVTFRQKAKVQGWLVKRARAEAANAEEEAEGEGDADVGSGEGGRLTQVKLSAAAARVRARLASEYESDAGAGGTSAGIKAASSDNRESGGKANADDDVEVF
ncbi:hypothetical protein Vretifemale_13234 [Volvox reticuliferus]|uniref:Uncharacterized protein n=1 Tax=Volvox reticuliferus TaxID=1737510 RepID=A0A8J4FPA9_9CHLO|nr:hypothetical protein Vretifemale_13234 [Volvox reticuliferus]